MIFLQRIRSLITKQLFWLIILGTLMLSFRIAQPLLINLNFLLIMKCSLVSNALPLDERRCAGEAASLKQVYRSLPIEQQDIVSGKIVRSLALSGEYESAAAYLPTREVELDAVSGYWFGRVMDATGDFRGAAAIWERSRVAPSLILELRQTAWQARDLPRLENLARIVMSLPLNPAGLTDELRVIRDAARDYEGWGRPDLALGLHQYIFDHTSEDRIEHWVAASEKGRLLGDGRLANSSLLAAIQRWPDNELFYVRRVVLLHELNCWTGALEAIGMWQGKFPSSRVESNSYKEKISARLAGGAPEPSHCP